MIRALFQRFLAWITPTFNLLDEDQMTEAYIFFPREGKPKLNLSKLDNPTPQSIMQCVQGTVEAALDLGRMYGQQYNGFIGTPTCPACHAVINNPAAMAAPPQHAESLVNNPQTVA
jgi:hypothetical protein